MMAEYEISRDDARGFLVCRVSAILTDEQVAALCMELDRELAAARGRGPLRLLWDQRGLPIIVDGNAEKLQEVWQRHYRENDRVAILVSSSLDKVHGKPVTAEDGAFFMSENAAHTWLGIGASQAA